MLVLRWVKVTEPSLANWSRDNMNPKWTQKPPTKPGKYWTRLGKDGAEYAVTVTDRNGKLMVECPVAYEIDTMASVAKDKGRQWRKRR